MWSPDLAMPPSEYFRKQCFVSVEPDEAPVKYVIDYMGNDPHRVLHRLPARRLQVPPRGGKLPELSTISEEDKHKILWDNCAAYYSLDG